MAIKNNKTCLCCGEKYTYCPDCSMSDAIKPAWYSNFHSEECMSLWTTLTKCNMGLITKQEAYGIIAKLELKPIKSYAACVQRDYDKIVESEKRTQKMRRKSKLIVDTVQIVNDKEQLITTQIEENIKEHEVVNEQQNINETL